MVDIESYKKREIALILLNVAVLAALFVVHVIFLFELGKPSVLLLATLTGRFVILMFELGWLQRLSNDSQLRLLAAHLHLSIAVNIVFAFTASVFGGTADSHYSVLMIIPIIQAAYHFNLVRMLSVTGVAILLTFAEVSIYFYRKPPIDYGEFFEAATVSLIFFVVGVVVWLLVGNLREEESKLQASFWELKMTQARLVREEKLAAVGELSSAIAHEIRNPVAMIASSLELAARKASDPALQSEMFAIATQEAKRLETLTSDFLSFARNSEPQRESCDVFEVLDYCASLTRARLEENRTTVSVLCERGVRGRFDVSQIRQAVLNLIINGADAVAKDGKISVGAHQNRESLIIFVENDGPAIAAELVDDIFDPFFTNKPRGTGLGLAIVRRILRAHGGDVALTANEPGRVRFELLLPTYTDGKNSDC